MKTIFRRPYLNKPYASMATDAGAEFKGEVGKYLYDQSIFHKVALPGRHTQQGPVESLNRILGRILNNYMNQKERDTGKVYREWDDKKVLQTIRVELNKSRKMKLPKDGIPDGVPDLREPSKFKEGDIVLRALDKPRDALNKEQGTEKFREGDYRYDPVAKKIDNIFYYPGDVPYRYYLAGIKNISYPESQLLPSTDTEEKFEVKKIIGKKKIKGKIYYQVWWKLFPRSQSTWEPRSELIKDGLQDHINEFEKK